MEISSNAPFAKTPFRRLALCASYLALALVPLFNLQASPLPQPVVVNTLVGQSLYGYQDGISNVARFVTPTGIARDGSNNLYVADAFNNTIRKISPAGVVTTLAGAQQQIGSVDGTGTNARFYSPLGVAVDSLGNVIVADTFTNKIRVVSPSGVVTTLAGNGVHGFANNSGTNSAFAHPFGVAVDSSNNIYVADTDNNMIRKITGNVVSTFAGKQNFASGSSDGQGTNASFNLPCALTVDGNGNILVADYGNHSIRRITSGGFVTTITSNLNLFPRGLVCDSGTNLYVCDNSSDVVMRIVNNATVQTTFSVVAGTMGVAGNQDGASSILDGPWGVVWDGKSSLYFTDYTNANVRAVNLSGTPGVSTFAGEVQSAGIGVPVDGFGLNARLDNPNSVAVDGGGTVYVADTYNNCIREIVSSSSGLQILTIAGQANGNFGTNDGTNSSFYSPYGICVDQFTNIYIADYLNDSVRLLTNSGSNWVTTTILTGLSGPLAIAVDSNRTVYVSEYGANTICEASNSGGLWNKTFVPSGFLGTFGIAVDNSGDVFVSDANSASINKISAGTAASFASAFTSTLGYVQGIAVDGRTNVYLADSANNAIWVCDGSGTLNNLIAGTPGVLGSVDGFGTNAQFYYPAGLALDASGNIYIADSLNNTVRKGSAYNAISNSLLSLSTYPAGLSVAANGLTYSNTPQFFVQSTTNTNALAAPNNTGYLFTNWTVNGVIATNKTNFSYVLLSNSTIVANYNTAYSLIATNSIGGIASGGGVYLPGSTNTLSEAASAGYLFTNWNIGGVVVGTNTNFSLVLTSNTTVTANFLPASSVTVLGTPTNGGTVSGSYSNYNGSSNTAIATPATNFVFTSWTSNGVIVSSNPTYTFILNSNIVLQANFVPLYSVAISSSPLAGGSVSTNGGLYVSNASVSVTAAANAGYLFTNWTVGGSQVSTNLIYTFSVLSNEAVSANFLKTFVLTAVNAPTNGGTNSGSGTFVSNTVNALTASPASGFLFANWTEGGAIISTNPILNVTLVSNTTATANYLQTFVLAASAAPSSGGSVSGTGTFIAGTTNRLTASTAIGYLFTNWTINGTVVSTSTNYDVVLVSNTTVLANFVKTWVVSGNFSPTNGGSITGLGTFVEGTTANLSVLTNAGFVFNNWTTNGVVAATTTNYSFAVSNDVTVTANFTPQYTIAVSANPTNGGNVLGGLIGLAGNSYTVTASTNTGYVFTSWTSNSVVVGTSNVYNFLLNTNVSLVANFTPQYSITVAASPTNGGVVSGGGIFVAGTTNSVSESPNPGFVFSNWTTSSGIQSALSNFSFVLTSNTSLTANFITTPPQIGVSAGSVALINGQSTVVDFGSVQTTLPGTIITFMVTNGGGQALVISSVAVPSGFQLNTNFNHTVAPLSSGAFSIQLLSGAIQTNSGPVVITANDPTNGAFTFPVTGVVTPEAPVIQVLAGALLLTNNQTNVVDFGRVQQNQTGPSIVFTISNSGGLPLHITNLNVPSGFNVIQPLTNLTLPGSNSEVFIVQVDTSAIATNLGNLIITNDGASNFSFSVPIAAEVTTPSPEIVLYDSGTNLIVNGQSAPVNFGTVQQPQAGPIRVFTITNGGSFAASIGVPTLPSGFALIVAPPGSLAATNTATFSVQLLSSNIGTNAGQISFANGDPTNNPFLFNITGFVVPPPAQVEVFNGLSQITNQQTTPVTFGPVQQNLSGPVKVFTVTNSGGLPLSLGAVGVPSGFVILTNLPATLAAGASSSLSVQLLTATTGTFGGNITFTNNDPTNFSFQFAISGSVLAPPHLMLASGATTITNGATNITDFGSVQKDLAGPTVTFAVTNTGAEPLAISGISLPTNFVLISNAPSAIAPGSNGAFSIQLTTSTAGVFNGYVLITNNDPTNALFSFPIRGTVLIPPHLLVFNGGVGVTNNQTNVVNFASVQQNLTGPIVTFTVSNAGQVSLTLQTPGLPAGFILISNLPGNLSAGGSGTFRVQLASAAVGTFSGAITITNGDTNNNPFSFPITGSVLTPPQIALFDGTNALTNGQTNAIDFGSVQQNLTGPTQTFTITNYGGLLLTLFPPTLPNGFTLISNTPGTIPPGSNGTFVVRLATTSVGTKSGSIVLTNGDPTNSPFVFPITGTVTAPPQLAIYNGAALIPNNQSTPVSFGTVQQNLTGTIITFTVTNVGGLPLTLGVPSIPSGFILVTNPPGTLSVGAAAQFSIQLVTSAVGVKSGNIVITNNGPTNGTYTFAISGIVGTPPPSIIIATGTNVLVNGQTNAVNFGSVFAGGGNLQLVFQVTNVGGLPLTVSTPVIPTGFTLVTNIVSPIAAGGHSDFVVAFTDTNVGSAAGSIVITNNDTNHNPFSFPIVGTRNARVISLAGNLALGGVSVGGSATGSLVISNAGNTTLTVSNISYPTGFSGAFAGTIAPGGAHTVSVLINAADAVIYGGTITVNSDATDGVNTIAASAFGESGDLVLRVSVSGLGTVTPSSQIGKTLKAGTHVTLKANPATGQIFLGWTGSIVTYRNPLTFVMAPSTVLQAVFVTNPFIATKGIYNGLFMATNGITFQTAGMLKSLNLTTRGTYSGSLLFNGGSHSFTGTFLADGTASNKVTLPAAQGGPVSLEMVLTASSNTPPQINGAVIGSTWSSPLVADLATNTVASAEYTMLILPDTDNNPPTGSPGGAGYALITNYQGTSRNPALAKATLTGALADGTAFTQSVPASQDGYVPFYVSLYATKGAAMGWLNLTLTNRGSDNLTWIHPSRPTGIYQASFVNNLSSNELPMAIWSAPQSGLSAIHTLLVASTFGNTNVISSNSITISSLGKVTGTDIAGTVNVKTGLLKVTIGTGASKVSASGVLLLGPTNSGAGYILTKTSSEAVILAQ